MRKFTYTVRESLVRKILDSENPRFEKSLIPKIVDLKNLGFEKS